MNSPYIIRKTELTPAEVNGLHEVTRHAPAKSAISHKVHNRLITFGYIEERQIVRASRTYLLGVCLTSSGGKREGKVEALPSN